VKPSTVADTRFPLWSRRQNIALSLLTCVISLSRRCIDAVEFLSEPKHAATPQPFSTTILQAIQALPAHPGRTRSPPGSGRAEIELLGAAARPVLRFSAEPGHDPDPQRKQPGRDQ